MTSSHKVAPSNSSLVSVLIRSADAFAAGVSALIAFYLIDLGHLSLEYRSAILLCALLTALIFPMFGVYRSWRGRSAPDQFHVILLSWVSVLISLIIISVVMKNSAHFSRLWLLLTGIIGAFTLFLLRLAIFRLLRTMRKHGWNTKHVVIFGAGDLGRVLLNQVRQAVWTGYQVVAFYDDNTAVQGKDIDGVPVYNPTSNPIDLYVSKTGVSEVWLTLPLRAEKRVNELVYSLRHQTCMLRFVPDIFCFPFLLRPSVSDIAGIPTLDLNLSPMIGINRVLKSLEDRLLGLIIFILISPILLMIAIAIKLDSKGPILFKQVRHGWDGRPINVYKFRSMRVPSEKDAAFKQATRNDPRVTKLGAFLRRTSLDELPQFYNVLQGRMSIVGPRPHPIALNEQYKEQIEFYMQRHKVKPGITGWAQINGWRGETDTIEKMQQRVEYDLYYIRNWSLFFDLKIIFLSVFKGFRSDKAY